MAAPSAKNQQPWTFVVIRNRELLEKLGGNLPNAKMTPPAPIAVAICGVLDKALPGEAREYWIQDAAATTENYLLASHALGLGAVWTGVHPISERIRILKDALKLPDGVEPFCLIPFGYPAAPAQVRDKWDPSAIHQAPDNGKNQRREIPANTATGGRRRGKTKRFPFSVHFSFLQ